MEWRIGGVWGGYCGGWGMRDLDEVHMLRPGQLVRQCLTKFSTRKLNFILIKKYINGLLG